ncbi:hypothetical protein BH10CHL1_BH10CHL1_26600 [soil metagenome]
MTESQHTRSEQEKPRNVGPDSRMGPSDMERSTSSSSVGVYDQDAPATTSTTTSTTTSSSNMMWIILLIVLIIVAFFILRQWM